MKGKSPYYYSIYNKIEQYVTAQKLSKKSEEIAEIEKNFVLIIDEINRANLSSVLGELIYALEYRDEPVESMYELDGDKKLILPPNLFIIGTMNTADRSVGHIDYAIRRRFAFVDILPSKEPIKEFAQPLFKAVSELFIKNFDTVDWKDPKLLKAKESLAADFHPEDVWIGHSYFITYKDGEDGKKELQMKLTFEILPILKEYLKDGILIDNEDVKTKIANLHV
jgi:5-methylcytosine-specific restriction endonuclease McrBC GTP-binding regulatory subunit McrB